MTDEEWALIAPSMPAANRIGRPRKTDLREAVNALLYIASTGCQGRFLRNAGSRLRRKPVRALRHQLHIFAPNNP
jgi:transposase